MEPQILITFEHFIYTVFAGLATFAVWILNKIGARHIETVDNIARELSEIRKELNLLSVRITRIEVVQERHEAEDERRRHEHHEST